jgi:lipopolysaccharide transport system ATP-binding protein
MIHNERGVAVHGNHTLQYDCPVPMRVARGTRLRFRHEIALQLSPQDYTFEVTLSSLARDDYEQRTSYGHSELYARIEQVCVLTRAGSFHVMLRPVGTRPIQALHHGAANLPGRCDVAALVPPEPEGTA